MARMKYQQIHALPMDKKPTLVEMITIKEFYPIWNELHCKNIVYGSNARNELMANWLESQILEAKAAYYKSEKTLYDDQTYDKLEEYLKVLRPESIV